MVSWGRCVAILVTCCMVGGCAPDAQYTPVRLTYSLFFPPTHGQAKLAAAWAREIETRTQGRVSIVFFPGGTLTKAEYCFQGVVDGASDIGMTAFSYTRGRFPLFEVLDMPLGYVDGVQATRVADALTMRYADYGLSDVVPLYAHAHGPGILATKQNVATLRDLQGLHVRATGTCSKMAAALGALPIAMAQGDTYEALQKGVVDATFCPIETLKGWKQGEVIQSVTDSRCVGYTTAFFVAMNRRTWQRLPSDVQEIFRAVSREWVARHGESWNVADDEARVFLAAMGKRTIVLSSEEQAQWRARVVPMFDDYQREATARGLPAEAFLRDARKLMNRSID